METKLATIQKNSYQLAIESTKISDMKKSDLEKTFIEILMKTYFDAGQVVQGYDTKQQSIHLKLLSNGLYEELQAFNFLRIDELKLAFKNGVRGEYGEWFGINIKTFHQWIKGFQFDQKRKDAIEKRKAENEKPLPPVMTPDQAEYEWKLAIKSQFSKFKESGIFVCEFPNFQFEEFEKRGLIDLSVSEKKEILSQAKNVILQKSRIKRLNPRSHAEIAELSAEIKRIEENQANSKDQAKIKAEARRIAIKKYYESINTLNL